MLVITLEFLIVICVGYHTEVLHCHQYCLSNGVLDCHVCWYDTGFLIAMCVGCWLSHRSSLLPPVFSIAISVAYQMEFLIIIIQDS